MMRASLLILTASLAATPAIAQTSPKPSQSADEIVCKMLPEGCGTPTYSDDQRIAGAELMQTFSFTAKKPKTDARAPAIAATPTTRVGVRRDVSSTRYPVGTRVALPTRTTRVTAVPRAAGPVGARAGFDMRVNFELASAALTADGRVQADEFAKALLNPKMAGLRFRIEGHTDAMGTRADNLQLAKARADAVAQYLIDKGVGKDRFETAGYGFDRPLNRSRPLSPVNRRVEIAVVK